MQFKLSLTISIAEASINYQQQFYLLHYAAFVLNRLKIYYKFSRYTPVYFPYLKLLFP